MNDDELEEKAKEVAKQALLMLGAFLAGKAKIAIEGSGSTKWISLVDYSEK